MIARFAMAEMGLLLWLGGCPGPTSSMEYADKSAEEDAAEEAVVYPTDSLCRDPEGPRECLYVYEPGASASLPTFPETIPEFVLPHFCRGDTEAVNVYVRLMKTMLKNKWTWFSVPRPIDSTLKAAVERWLFTSGGLDFRLTISSTRADEATAMARSGGSDVLGSASLPAEPYGRASTSCEPRSDNPCRTLECTITVFGENATGPIVYTTDAGTPAADAVSLEAIFVHELGHVLGLAETDNTPGYAVSNYWPLPGDAPMDPHEDEHNALLFIYGPP